MKGSDSGTHTPKFVIIDSQVRALEKGESRSNESKNLEKLASKSQPSMQTKYDVDFLKKNAIIYPGMRNSEVMTFRPGSCGRAPVDALEPGNRVEHHVEDGLRAHAPHLGGQRRRGDGENRALRLPQAGGIE